MSAPFGFEHIDLPAVLEVLRQQEEAGHNAATDAEKSVGQISTRMTEMAVCANDAAHAAAEPNLDLIYRRAARVAAMSLALMRRVRLEQGR